MYPNRLDSLYRINAMKDIIYSWAANSVPPPTSFLTSIYLKFDHLSLSLYVVWRMAAETIYIYTRAPSTTLTLHCLNNTDKVKRLSE